MIELNTLLFLSLLRRNITVLHICTAFLMIAFAISNTWDGSLFSHITFHVLAKESHITLPRHFAFLKSHVISKSCRYLARFEWKTSRNRLADLDESTSPWTAYGTLCYVETKVIRTTIMPPSKLVFIIYLTTRNCTDEGPRARISPVRGL